MSGLTEKQMLEIATKETSRLTNAEDREDARQEMLLGFLEATARGDSNHPGFRTFQWAYARGRLLSFLDRQERYNFRHNRHIDAHATLSDDGMESLLTTQISNDVVDGAVLDAEQSQTLWEAVNTLPERAVKVIQDRFVHNRTLDQIGQDLGVTKERVRQIEEQALDRLRLRLVAN